MNTTTPKDVQGRTPGSSGDAAQKFRLDAVLALVREGVSFEDAIDGAVYAETGDLPDEGDDQ